MRGATIARGTAIAVFDANGSYGNHQNGSSHAAIYLGQDATGIQVIDQWVHVSHGVPRPHMASARTIRWRGGHGTEAVDDGDRFDVVD